MVGLRVRARREPALPQDALWKGVITGYQYEQKTEATIPTLLRLFAYFGVWRSSALAVK